MIKFSAWNIDAIGSPLGRQYDNLTRSLDIVGNIPDGWTWDVLLQIGDNLNIISLSPSEEGLHATLTADMLAIKGKYRLQLRASQADKIRHTNIITVDVLESISGDAKWPEVPSEFTQLEQRVRELSEEAGAAAEQAENARDQYPKIINGNWQVYDPETGTYVDTGVYAGGGGSYVLPSATADALGGVKADPATGMDTQPVRIGPDKKLYTASGGGNLPSPNPESAGMIPAVNAEGDGYELTLIGRYDLVGSVEIQEEVQRISFDLDKSYTDYLAFVYFPSAPTVSATMYVGIIDSVLGGPCVYMPTIISAKGVVAGFTISGSGEVISGWRAEGVRPDKNVYGTKSQMIGIGNKFVVPYKQVSLYGANQSFVFPVGTKFTVYAR